MLAYVSQVTGRSFIGSSHLFQGRRFALRFYRDDTARHQFGAQRASLPSPFDHNTEPVAQPVPHCRGEWFSADSAHKPASFGWVTGRFEEDVTAHLPGL